MPNYTIMANTNPSFEGVGGVKSQCMAMVNLMKLNELVSQGYLTTRKHPDADLWIFNYTPKAQYEKYWIDETVMSRGLIVSGGGEIVARPFEKFFNLDEYEGELPDEQFNVYEKIDGSLGILYWVGDEAKIATRGSFTSRQAEKGTEILQKRYSGLNLDRRYTYLFEIIYPENKIVVEYGGMEDLVLLAVRETKSGREEKLQNVDLPFPKVGKIDWDGELADLTKREGENKEGFVIRYESGLRLKIKFSEYVRLHKLVTGVTSKVIWERLKSGEGVEEMLSRVPDEFYGWVKQTKDKLEKEFDEVEKRVEFIVGEARKLETRKDQAGLIRGSNKYSGVAFAMLDGKNYQKIIWDIVRPVTAKPFMEEAEIERRAKL